MGKFFAMLLVRLSSRTSCSCSAMSVDQLTMLHIHPVLLDLHIHRVTVSLPSMDIGAVLAQLALP